MSSTICMDQRLLHSDMQRFCIDPWGTWSSRVKLKMACFAAPNIAIGRFVEGPTRINQDRGTITVYCGVLSILFTLPRMIPLIPLWGNWHVFFWNAPGHHHGPGCGASCLATLGEIHPFIFIYMMELRTRRHRGILCFLMLVACKWCVWFTKSCTSVNAWSVQQLMFHLFHELLDDFVHQNYGSIGKAPKDWTSFHSFAQFGKIASKSADPVDPTP